jgi:hypothetical protein
MKKCINLLSFFILIFISFQSYALPRFALKRGEANCLGCHVNPTGGGIRSLGGESFSIDDLPMWKRGDKFTGQISDGLKLGGDFRSQLLLYSQTGPTGENNSDTTTKQSIFQEMSLAIELDVKATNTLHGYLRYDPLATTEGWALIHLVHPSGEIIESGEVMNDLYFKVGSFMPAFGVRFDDHTTFVKGGTTGHSAPQGAGFFWTPGYVDPGAEIGTTLFDHIGLIAGVFSGSESFDGTNNKAFCFRANISGEIVEDVLAGEIGASYFLHAHNSGDLTLAGGHAGIRSGPVSLLAEYDVGNHLRSVANAKALCIEGAVHAAKGLDLMMRFETYNNEKKADTLNIDVKSSIMVGAQWFPLRFIELRPELRLLSYTLPNSDEASNRDSYKQMLFLLQTHVFF